MVLEVQKMLELSQKIFMITSIDMVQWQFEHVEFLIIWCIYQRYYSNLKLLKRPIFFYFQKCSLHDGNLEPCVTRRF